MESMRLKYLGHSIVFQEVPDEISLAINISGCPYKCRGCHSSYLWEYKGRYISDDLEELIKQTDGITCVCFMGGDQNRQELKSLIDIVHFHNLKCCLYTGSDIFSTEDIIDLQLDYVKVGGYIEEFGGLHSKNTNQKFFKVSDNKIEDITYRFQRRDIC